VSSREGTCESSSASVTRPRVARNITTVIFSEPAARSSRQAGVAVSRPRRRLESLFLEIVEKARSEGVQTAGARSGGRVAEFLEKPTAGGVEAATESQATPASDAVDTDLLGSLVAPPARQAAERGPREA
jgi:hypothetical protein